MLPALGCAGPQQRPSLASSVGHASHAQAYPKHVAAALSRMQEDGQRTREAMVAFPTYAGQLKSPDWELVEEIARLADEEGRGQAFASAFEDARTVRRFFEDRDRELGRKIAGSVNHATKDKGCTEDVGPTAFYATRRSVAKQLTELSRDSNAAQHALTEVEASLGRRNLKVMQLQVEAISLASYTAHVGLHDHGRELERLAAESADAERTLERAAQELLSHVDSAPNAAEKKALEKRLRALLASQSVLVEQRGGLEQAAEEAQARIDSLRADYQAAFSDLIDSFQAQ